MNRFVSKIKDRISKNIFYKTDISTYNQGQILSRLNRNYKNINSINEVEFKVFSQWGDDGIIDWLVENIDIESRMFIEFGVEDYRESNTRFLMMHRNWTGLILDGSKKNINKIKNSYYYWMYDLTAIDIFISKDNINELISNWTSESDIGLLHIDIDGNDYWVWQAIECIEPTIVIIEYNALFGCDRNISIPYSKDFCRKKAHYSHLYFGASLPAINELAKKKGYTFIGCNLAGNNAYFIKKEKMTKQIPTPSIEEGFRYSKFRECRNQYGKLTYPSKKEALSLIANLPIYNIISSKVEVL